MSDEIDAKQLYGRYQDKEDWQNNLHKKTVHKALNIPMDDDVKVDTTTTNVSGLDWKHLAVIAATKLLIDVHGNALLDELHRAIGEGEIGPAAVPRAEAPGHVPIAAELVRRTAPTRLRIDHVVNRHVGGAMAGAAIEVPPRTATEAVPDQEVIV